MAGHGVPDATRLTPANWAAPAKRIVLIAIASTRE